MNGPGYGYKRMEGLPDPATNGNKRMDRVLIRNSQMNQIQIKKETNGPAPDTQFPSEPNPDKARNEWTGAGYGKKQIDHSLRGNQQTEGNRF